MYSNYWGYLLAIADAKKFCSVLLHYVMSLFAVRILRFTLMLATICWTSLFLKTRQELIWFSSNFRASVFYRSLFRACKRLPITPFIFVWDWKKSSGRISAKSSHLQMTVLRVLKHCSRHRFITAAEGVAPWSLISICEYFCEFPVAYVLTSHSPWNPSCSYYHKTTQ